MTESMTGFGEGAAAGQTLDIVVSARSVNHRYLDLAVRMPEFLRRHERAIADLVRSTLQRGRVELRVDATCLGNESRHVEIRTDILRAYRRALREANEAGLIEGELGARDLVRLPEVIAVETASGEAGPEDVDALFGAVESAVTALRQARRDEGARLRDSLSALTGQLEREVTALDEMREVLRSEIETRLRERLAELVGGVEIDPTRLAMEVAILVDRSDIQEEIDRLQAHLAGFAELLELETPVGKKLDFLCQEILRELNTIGSKCRDSKALEHVLESKVMCEQIREQVQNIQ